MEKAILKTLYYSDIFDYPLKGYEVYKWLIGYETSLLKVEKILNSLVKKRKIQKSRDFYFLKNKNKLISKRQRRLKCSHRFLIKAKILTQTLKLIPWIKLVGISGGLALDNADKKDDIDLFLITSKKRLWISRLLSILILDFLGVRRKVNMKNVSGKICVNTILDEDHLQQEIDLYTAHEVLQMKVLWQREGIYSKYLKDNEWIFKYLPNWSSPIKYLKPKKGKVSQFFNILEEISKLIQLKIMKKPEGLERIEEGGLYFYPNDSKEQILSLYRKKVKHLISP